MNGLRQINASNIDKNIVISDVLILSSEPSAV